MIIANYLKAYYWRHVEERIRNIYDCETYLATFKKMLKTPIEQREEKFKNYKQIDDEELHRLIKYYEAGIEDNRPKPKELKQNNENKEVKQVKEEEE